MGSGYQLLDREVRIYDGTSGTPNYVRVALLADDLSLPIVPPQPDEELIADAGNVTSDSFYAIASEVNTFQPQDVDVTFLIQSEKQDLVSALGNPFNRSPWTVGGVTWNPIAPASMGTRQNSRGAAIIPPTSAITRNVDTMVAIYARWAAPPADSGGDPLIIGLIGVAIGQGTIQQNGATVSYTTTMRHYGGYAFDLSAFPAGTETTF